MPEFQPFRAVRYSFGRVRDLARVLAPPFDRLTSTQREVLAARDPHNVSHLAQLDDRGGQGRWGAAGKLLESWLDSGWLVRDDRPGFCVVAQTFAHEGRTLVRRGLCGRMRVHPYSDGVVAPVEQTPPDPQARCLEHARQVRASLSPVLGLVADDDCRLRGLMESASSRAPDATCTGDDGVTQRLWVVTDRTAVGDLRAEVAERKVVLAGGLRLYEAALQRRDELDAARKSPDKASHRYVLTCLCALGDPGLVVAPTHLTVRGLERQWDEAAKAAAEEFFTFAPVTEDLTSQEGCRAALARLTDAGKASPAFLMVAARGALATLMRLRPGADVDAVGRVVKSPAPRSLDAAMVRGLVLQRILGLSPDEHDLHAKVESVRDFVEAVRRTQAGECQWAFALNAPRLEQVLAVAAASEPMPPDSVWFPPEIPAGLVINPVDPRELAA